jgi:hypothetical protein
MKRNLFIATALAGVAFVSATAESAVYFEFNTVIAGDPQGGPAFATLLIENNGTDSVSMTFSHTADPNLAGGQAIKTLLLNVDSYVPVTVTSTSSKLTSFSSSEDGQNDSGAMFDLRMEFDIAPPSDRFVAGDSIVMEATGTGLTENSFAAISTGSAQYEGMVHFLSIPPDGGSAKVVTGEPVPEPASLGAIALGVAALLGRRRKK